MLTCDKGYSMRGCHVAASHWPINGLSVLKIYGVDGGWTHDLHKPYQASVTNAPYKWCLPIHGATLFYCWSKDYPMKKRVEGPSPQPIHTYISIWSHDMTVVTRRDSKPTVYYKYNIWLYNHIMNRNHAIKYGKVDEIWSHDLPIKCSNT